MKKFLKNNEIDPVRFFFTILTVFFFLVSPLALFANTHLRIPLDNLAIAITTVALISLIIFFKKNESPRLPTISHIKIITIQNYPLPVALLAYFLLHTLYFHFYIFIPEWDSYGDLININQILTNGFTDTTYRPLFSIATALLASLLHIDPYYVFSIVFIILQSTILFVVYKFLNFYEIKKRILQMFFLLGVVSIPVLSMEIDMTRPQNVFIVFLPLYIYYLHDFLISKKKASLILASLIAIFGPSYHEFFTFILLLHLITLCALGYKKFIQGKLNPHKIFLFTIITIILLSLIPSFAHKLPIATNIFSIMRSASQGILSFEKWQIWFIDNYWSDSEALQMGWPGMSGAIKYYSYYASPFILLLILLILGILLYKNDFSFIKNKLFNIAFPFFALFFFFSEISPRLNYHYLPERYWIFIDITIIFLSIPFLRFFEEKIRITKGFLITILLCIIVGLSGTIYIAQGKKSLTSELEYSASEWIKENTPPEAFIISQSANSPLIRYFANRKMFYPTESFFLQTDIEREPRPEKIIEMENLKNAIIVQMQKDFDAYISGTISFDDFENKIRKNKKTIASYQLIIQQQLPKMVGPVYILYSTDKFNTIYSQREWWKKTNFYNANLEKFDKNFEKVYQNDAVKIWKIQ